MDEVERNVLVATVDAITVVTVTRRRIPLLRRAMKSVIDQDFDGLVEHLVVVDDDTETVSALDATGRQPNRPLSVLPARQAEAERTDHRAFVYPRLAQLLNLGIGSARTDWIAFLDDDNEFEPNHVSSLVATVSISGAEAVHSARALVWPDGTPYLEPCLPSAATLEEGQRQYELLCEREVWVRGTNVLLDRVDRDANQASLNSTVMTDGDPMFLVDQNLWLISRDILIANPIPEIYDAEDIAANTCPDDKMLAALVRAQVAIGASGLPSVRYTVGGGGISNGSFVESFLKRDS